MRRFVWRLQPVLNVKTREEERKRAELLQLTEKLAETRRQLLERQRILEQMICDIASRKPQERLPEQAFFLKHSLTNDEQIKKLTNKIRELETQVRNKMAEVLKLRRFKEGLERLRSEAKREFIEEQERLDQKELDEMGVIRFARKRSVSMQLQ
jgi:flagellar biosynthesis chaperone FliJ